MRQVGLRLPAHLPVAMMVMALSYQECGNEKKSDSHFIRAGARREKREAGCDAFSRPRRLAPGARAYGFDSAVIFFCLMRRAR